jgi:hypothetical protein
VVRLLKRKFFSRSQDAVIRVYDAAGNVLETRCSQPLADKISRNSDPLLIFYPLLFFLRPTELSSVGKASLVPLG